MVYQDDSVNTTLESASNNLIDYKYIQSLEKQAAIAQEVADELARLSGEYYGTTFGKAVGYLAVKLWNKQ